MWSVIPNEIKSSVFSYKDGAFEEIKHDRSDTCEDVCTELCRRWKISPLVRLLFGLRIHKTKLWLAGCRQLKDGEKYEFRIRFKVNHRQCFTSRQLNDSFYWLPQIPRLSDLYQLDKNAYDYFYHQVRHDFLYEAIPEVTYPNFKDELLGLCVTTMYIEMIEINKGVNYYKRNYKKYVPSNVVKHHSWFLKNKIESSLNEMIEKVNTEEKYKALRNPL